MKVHIPLRTGRGLNDRLHWRVKAKHVKEERLQVAWALAAHNGSRPEPPLLVTLTRIAPSNGLDDDGAVGALKAVRDQIAQWLGVDDKHKDVVRYAYAQRRGPWAVEIDFQPMEKHHEQSGS